MRPEARLTVPIIQERRRRVRQTSAAWWRTGGREGGRGGVARGGPRTTMTRQVDALLGTVFGQSAGKVGSGLQHYFFFSSSCNDVTQSGTAPQSERTVQRGLERRGRLPA